MRVTHTQARVLAVLVHENLRMTAGDVARTMYRRSPATLVGARHSSTVGRVLHHLEQKGLVASSGSKPKLWRPTPKGRQLHATLRTRSA